MVSIGRGAGKAYVDNRTPFEINAIVGTSLGNQRGHAHNQQQPGKAKKYFALPIQSMSTCLKNSILTLTR